MDGKYGYDTYLRYTPKRMESYEKDCTCKLHDIQYSLADDTSITDIKETASKELTDAKKMISIGAFFTMMNAIVTIMSIAIVILSFTGLSQL